jgi:hypothetical protein
VASSARRHAQTSFGSRCLYFATLATPVAVRYQGVVLRISFQVDAALAMARVYEFLEIVGTEYALRLPINKLRQEQIGYLLKRRSGVLSTREKMRSSGRGYRA